MSLSKVAKNGQNCPFELLKKAENGVLPPVSLLFLLAGINLHLFI
jgi:hypothetical protein